MICPAWAAALQRDEGLSLPFPNALGVARCYLCQAAATKPQQQQKFFIVLFLGLRRRIMHASTTPAFY